LTIPFKIKPAGKVKSFASRLYLCNRLTVVNKRKKRGDRQPAATVTPTFDLGP